MPRGQVSLEALLLLSVMVGVLYISLSLLSRTYSLGTAAIGDSSSQSLLRSIASSTDEVCAMGDGNSRVVDAGAGEFSLSYENGNLTLLGSSGSEYSRGINCEVIVQGGAFSGSLKIENSEGAVSISRFSPE